MSWLVHLVERHIELVKLGAAALAFVFGLYQYTRSQQWKRLEFVAAEMKIFFDDPAAKLAMTMLDWSQKRVALYKFREPSDTSHYMVNYEIVASSLGVGPAALEFDRIETAIREIFERFLEFLARFEGFVATGLVKRDDLVPYLDYWVKLISGNDPHAPQATAEVLPNLWKFIDYYGYRDVRNFVGRYHHVAFPEIAEIGAQRLAENHIVQ